MRQLSSAKVEKLFGYVNHEVNFRDTEPTIITSPNGAGKTHLLKLIRATLILDIKELVKLPFAKFTLSFSDKTSVEVFRTRDEGLATTLRFSARQAGRAIGKSVTLSDAESLDLGADVPDFLEEKESGRWLDNRSGRTFTAGYVNSRFGVYPTKHRYELLSESPILIEIISGMHSVLIDTQRLDLGDSINTADPVGQRIADRVSGPTSIDRYIGRIKAQVVEARTNSVRQTQTADVSFAARALAASKMNVGEAGLHRRYDEISASYSRLARNSLAVGEAPLEFPEKTSPTVKRILHVFLDDWERRLEPLIPVNQRLELLRDILDSKLRQSGKTTFIAPSGQLMFRSSNGGRVRVSTLSSGEQHLVALFTLLVFAAREGSIVLIDEPEISMHAAWKHAFLDDVSRVAALVDLQVVIATHSTGVLNGRWDLEEPLSLHAPESDIFSDEDDVDADSDELFS